MKFRTPLGTSRGLGSAKDGTHHWWMQRVTAVALILLGAWFVVSVLQFVGEDRGTVVAWLQSPINATLMVLLLVATFHHAQLGLQVVIEDYVHGEGVKIAAILAVKGVALLLGGIAVFSVLKIAFSR